MGKKNTTIWGFWKWHSNHVVLFMAAAIVIVMSTAKRPNWMENNKMQLKDYSSCDMFSGRWVYDNSTHPMYSGLNCAYMNDEIACDKYGRNDTRYQRWRWQPHGCNLPRLVETKSMHFNVKQWGREVRLIECVNCVKWDRFDAREMLERLRGKRMVYVGDSLNRNQWVSMVCLLESSIASEHKSFISNGSLMSFRAEVGKINFHQHVIVCNMYQLCIINWIMHKD